MAINSTTSYIVCSYVLCTYAHVQEYYLLICFYYVQLLTAQFIVNIFIRVARNKIGEQSRDFVFLLCIAACFEVHRH